VTLGHQRATSSAALDVGGSSLQLMHSALELDQGMMIGAFDFGYWNAAYVATCARHLNVSVES
jgi:hypothetical protein